MAISVKNHEDRIAALEKKIVSSAYSETVLWSGKQSGNNIATLSQSINNFDKLIIIGQGASYGGISAAEISVKEFKNHKNLSSCILDVDNISINYKTDTQVSTWGYKAYMLKIIGVKFSNVILYYVSNIIYIKFKRSLNSAIAIFNRIFLHKFI